MGSSEANTLIPFIMQLRAGIETAKRICHCYLRLPSHSSLEACNRRPYQKRMSRALNDPPAALAVELSFPSYRLQQQAASKPSAAPFLGELMLVGANHTVVDDGLRLVMEVSWSGLIAKKHEAGSKQRTPSSARSLFDFLSRLRGQQRNVGL